MQGRPAFATSTEVLETESETMAHLAPTYLQIESFSLSHIEIMFVSLDGMAVCIAAFAQDSMWPEHISVDRIELSSTKLAAGEESSILMVD